MNLESIKLIVWDLDDTLWSGTLSEGGVIISPQVISLINDLTDCGIINSICSKNNFESAKEKLSEYGIWDLFVFPSINWESKGPQLKDKLDKMALRPVNVLFIDDNVSNIGEAKHYLPDIQADSPDVIEELIGQVALSVKKDKEHNRLKQYKLLEEKDIAAKSYSSSEDFLFASKIQATIHHDCLNQIQRIHELLMRSNQLNYTKKRISIEELESILKNPCYDCGYITVKDRFGNYGLIGFYAEKESTLEHFLFSCRTMGQKIEQWVYAQLGFPELSAVGEVRTILNKTDCPAWINADIPEEEGLHGFTTDYCQGKILLKGPCDLSHSQVYIKGGYLFESEFTYVTNNGKVIDMHNHSVHIEGLHTYSEETMNIISQDCSFIDPPMLSGGFFTNGYDIIFLSTLIESDYLVYQRKDSNDIKVVFGGPNLTDPINWNRYVNGTCRTGGNHFTEEYLRSFSKVYECIGMTTPEQYVSFLKKCLRWLPEKTTLCLILGATKFSDGQEVTLRHEMLNKAIKLFSKTHQRIRFIEIDDCINDSSDYLGGINHFSTRVYYEIAQRMIQVIQSVTGKSLKSYSSRLVLFDDFVISIRRIIKRFVKHDTFFYRLLSQFYKFVYKDR